MSSDAPSAVASAREGAAVHVADLTLEYGGAASVLALDRTDLTVARGQFVSIVGPSGCGKSTLLKVLAGLLRPNAGTARIESHDAIGHPGLAAYMPQRDLLLPWRRALANATLGAELAGVKRGEARQTAKEWLPRFGLEGFERAWPSQLSGGMRQRLALLRTFLVPRDVMLLDEPFGALDAITRREMQGWLQSVWAQDERSVLLVTHDVEEALVLSDVVYVMSPRPGSMLHRVDVPFPRPRDTRTTTLPAFAALKAQLLEALDHSSTDDRARPRP